MPFSFEKFFQAYARDQALLFRRNGKLAREVILEALI
jgi:hypothetical protein